MSGHTTMTEATPGVRDGVADGQSSQTAKREAATDRRKAPPHRPAHCTAGRAVRAVDEGVALVQPVADVSADSNAGREEDHDAAERFNNS